MKARSKVLLLALWLAASQSACRHSITDAELVTFYPAYGFIHGDYWVVPRLRLRVHEPRTAVLNGAALTLGLKHKPEEVEKFKKHADGFFQDDQSGETVTFVFDADRREGGKAKEYALLNHNGDKASTDKNGMAEGMIKIPLSDAQKLIEAQRAEDGWLTFTATSKEHTGKGRVQLIAATGVSIISDIDDTIKVTGIPQGSRTVVENTFFRDFVEADGMVKMYTDWKKAEGDATAFHYVSGGFWQLYSPLDGFLTGPSGAGFPRGSFHMRVLPLRVTDLPAIIKEHGMTKFTPKEDNDTDEAKPRAALNEEPGTYGHKLARIREIMNDFPERTFILVGDSGERDPEVYRKIKAEYGSRITRTIIREATMVRSRTLERGMEVIHLTSKGAEILPPESAATAIAP
jgi:hypothetical protein